MAVAGVVVGSVCPPSGVAVGVSGVVVADGTGVKLPVGAVVGDPVGVCAVAPGATVSPGS